MTNTLYLFTHPKPGNGVVLSVDLLRHMQEGLPEQHDELLELLELPTPIELPVVACKQWKQGDPAFPPDLPTVPVFSLDGKPIAYPQRLPSPPPPEPPAPTAPPVPPPPAPHPPTRKPRLPRARPVKMTKPLTADLLLDKKGTDQDTARTASPTSTTETVFPCPKRARVAHAALTDAVILKFVDVHGPRWRALSESMGGRRAGYSDDVVRNRYIRMMEALGTPYETRFVARKKPKKPERPVVAWTDRDDQLIAQGIELYGTQWAQLAKLFEGRRTQQAVRNRANRMGIYLPAHARQPKSEGV